MSPLPTPEFKVGVIVHVKGVPPCNTIPIPCPVDIQPPNVSVISPAPQLTTIVKSAPGKVFAPVAVSCKLVVKSVVGSLFVNANVCEAPATPGINPVTVGPATEDPGVPVSTETFKVGFAVENVVAVAVAETENKAKTPTPNRVRELSTAIPLIAIFLFIKFFTSLQKKSTPYRSGFSKFSIIIFVNSEVSRVIIL